jgi:cytochrome P450
MCYEAGETIAFTMTVMTYHLLANPKILRKLKLELQAAIPDPEVSTLQVALERLPYLTAVIKEGVRLSYGSSSRLPRVPLEPMVFKSGGKEWIIPAGTPVSRFR